MPKVKLASEQLRYEGLGSSGVSPILFNPPPALPSPSGAGIRAPQVSVGAANIGFKPLPNPQIQVTNEWQAAAGFADTLMTKAFEFQDKQAQLDSDLLVMQYEQEQSKKWNGYTDESGNWVQGVSELKGKQFTDAHQGFVTGSDQGFQDLLMNSEESVRQKAALRMYGIRDTYLNRAAGKKAEEFAYAQEQSLLARHQQVYKEIEVDQERGWAQLREFAGNPHWGEAEKIDIMAKGGVYTTEKIYENSKKAGASDEVAYKNSLSWFEAHRDEFPEDAENKVASALRQQGEAIVAKKEKDAKEAAANAQSVMKYQGMGQVYTGLIGGPATMASLPLYYQSVVNTYADKPHLIPGVMKDHYEDAFRGVMMTKGYDYARVAWKNLKAMGSEMAFAPPEVITDTEVFINGTLRTEAEAMTKHQRTTEKNGIFQQMMKAQTPQEVDGLLNQLGQTEMHAETQSFLYNFGTNRKTAMSTRVADGTKNIQKTNYLQLRREAENGSSIEYENRVYDEAEAGNIDGDQAIKLLDRAEKFTFGNLSPAYKDLRSQLGKLVDLEEMYYDPRNQRVGFWNMLEEDEKAEIENAQELTGRSDDARRMLAVSSLLEQAEMWKKQEQGRDYNQFIPEFFSQQPEVKRGIVSNTVRKAYNAMQGPTPYIWVDEGPLQEGVEYEWTGPEGDAPQAGLRPEARVLNASGLTLDESVARVEGTTTDNIVDQKLGEYAYHTIPEGRSSLYSGKATEWLLALQMVREQRPFIDNFSIHEIESVVNATLQTPDYKEWRTNKRNSFSASMR